MVSGTTANTAAYGVIGFPVRHSLSPVMQSAAFAYSGISAAYLAFEVSPEDFPAALEGAYRLGFSGLNVTVPHKRAAFALAVESDVGAAATGAANTLVRCSGGWKAYNTDIAGFVGAVRADLGFSPHGRRAAILGAGGAARAAIVGLLGAGVSEVFVGARDRGRADALVTELGGEGKGLRAVAVGDVPPLLGPGDLLVSATPVGLDPTGDWPWPLAGLAGGVLVYDMAYSRGTTPLEDKAKRAGFKAACGRMMLVLQGAEAFGLWTGLTPPVEVMSKALNCS